MKAVCILNLIAITLVFICNFDLSDLPYFQGLVQNIYDNFAGVIARIADKAFMHPQHGKPINIR